MKRLVYAYYLISICISYKLTNRHSVNNKNFMKLFDNTFNNKQINSISSPIQLDLSNDSFILSTSCHNYILDNNNSSIFVDLYSMIHIGDYNYYQTINELMNRYDIVLYELITDNSNTIKLPIQYNNTIKPYKKRLINDIISIKTETLAKALNLSNQLVLPMRNSNWFIADLDSSTIQLLESLRLENIKKNYWLSLLSGRLTSDVISYDSYDYINENVYDIPNYTLTYRNNLLLRNFFVSERLFVIILRLLSYLLPCPELTCLLLDWSKDGLQSGSLLSSKLLSILSQLILKGKFNIVRKILFAQQLVSGLLDEGSLGGIAQSDIGIRVKARNQECCRILNEFIYELSLTSDTKSIAVLYGAYHINDLNSKLKSINLKPINESNNSNRLIAWEVPLSKDITNNTSLLPIGIISIVYLLLGALDWRLLISLIEGFINTVITSDSLILSDDIVITSGVTIAYFIFYIQRHLYLLNMFSTIGVQWDKGLFD